MNKTLKVKSEQNWVNLIYEHLYAFVILFCLLLFPLGFCQYNNISDAEVIFEAIIAFIFLLSFVVLFRTDKPLKNNVIILTSFTFLIIVFVLMSLLSRNHLFTMLMVIPFFLGEIIFSVVMIQEKSFSINYLIILMISLGIIVRYCYILFVNSCYYQHDVMAHQTVYGHWGYIMYWYYNGLQIPDFNVTDYFQYYHPPLHHIIMAFMLRILTSCGMSLEISQEAVQFLPFLYSSICMIVCYRIFILLGLKNTGMVVSMAVVCLYPTFIIWSGSYNNDMLSVLFMMLSILYTIKWYKAPSLIKIIPIAVCIGCGMMTKLSAWMVAPAIAFIFLYVFIKNIKNSLTFIGQYTIFGIICIPLGLWWGIRNFIKFNIPVAYILDPQSTKMSVKDVPVMQRLFDFSFFQFKYPFILDEPYNEYNPLIGLLKTSIFDEMIFYLGKFNFIFTLFLIITFIIALISFIGLCYTIVNKNINIDVPLKISISIFFITFIVSYYIFCFKFPYVCTENIRYCIPVIPILGMGLGFFVNHFIEKLHKPIIVNDNNNFT